MFRQSRQQLAAAEHEDVLALLLLQLRHLLSDVSVQERPVPRERFFQRARRHKLREAIHSNCEVAFCRFHRGPSRGEALERLAPKEQSIAREELIVLVYTELVVEILVRPATERELADATRIL